jgi:hydrogenase-4 component B
VAGADSYTASAFANPTRRVLAAVLHTRAGIERIGPGPVLDGAPDGRAAWDARAGTALAGRPVPHAETASAGLPVPLAGTAHAGLPVPHVGYTTDVIEVVEQYVYRPALRPVTALVQIVKRLQSGRLDAYLAYMLIALIALLAVVAGLS